jgi:CRP-like cAMP-binding protein
MRKIVCERCAIRERSCAVALPPDKLDEIGAYGVATIYKPRQVVFHEGMPAAGLYVVCEGTVKLYQSDRFGRDYILGFAEPGDVLGELPGDPSEPYSTSAEALTESQLCYLPRERLAALIDAYPSAGMRLIAALSKALAAARRKAGDLALKGAEHRLATLLVELLDESGAADGNGHAELTLGHSRRELAEMIGVSPETAIRLLARLRQRGILTTRGRSVVVTDVEKLTRLAQQHDLAAS